MSNNIKNIIYNEEYYGNIYDNSIRCVGFLNTETGKYDGEYITFYPDGRVQYRGFNVNGNYVGKLNAYDVSGRFNFFLYSFEIYDVSIASKANQKIIRSTIPISYSEYKKELARIRLGLKEIPQLNWKIDNNSLYSHLKLKHKIPDYVW
jgi:hypothetical protein